MSRTLPTHIHERVGDESSREDSLKITNSVMYHELYASRYTELYASRYHELYHVYVTNSVHLDIPRTLSRICHELYASRYHELYHVYVTNLAYKRARSFLREDSLSIIHSMRLDIKISIIHMSRTGLTRGRGPSCRTWECCTRRQSRLLTRCGMLCFMYTWDATHFARATGHIYDMTMLYA